MRPAFILPDVKDESKWFNGKHHFLYSQERHAFAFEGSVTNWISFNTSLAKPDDFKSWSDLLNPKWKGKIVSYDPTIPGTGAPALWYFYTNPNLGPKFISDFYGKMDIILSRDYRQLIDWMATGKAAICLAYSEEARKAKLQGLPIDELTHIMKEGNLLTHGQGIVSLINPAPHPKAATVFVNWLLSRAGQMSFQDVTFSRLGFARVSLRTDVPKDKAVQFEIPRVGEKYFYEGPSSEQERKESVKILKDVMK